MTPREKRIVDRFRKQNPKSMRHDSDQELREVEGTKDSAKEDEVWEIINHIKGE